MTPDPIDDRLMQFTASATATATRRLPTPAGPAKSNDGGSVPRAMARDNSETSRR
jgi:hypothetical protein